MDSIAKPSFLILGCGPIGGILTSFIADNCKKIGMVDANEAHFQKIHKDGLKTIIGNEIKKTRFSKCYRTLNEAKDFSYDYFVVALKTSVMETVIPPAASLIPQHARVVSLQNGIGSEDFLAQHFGRDRVLRIVVNYAGTMVEPGLVKQTFFHPPNYIGACAEKGFTEARSIADFLSKSSLKTVFTDEIKKHEWEKTAMNVAMSSVSAITGLNMKQVMTFKPARELVAALLKETIQVSKAAGTGLGEEYLGKSLKYLDEAGPHLPSMRIDIENKRETEINFLNQKILDAAVSHKVRTPFLECVTSLIKGMGQKLKE